MIFIGQEAAVWFQAEYRSAGIAYRSIYCPTFSTEEACTPLSNKTLHFYVLSNQSTMIRLLQRNAIWARYNFAVTLTFVYLPQTLIIQNPQTHYSILVMGDISKRKMHVFTLENAHNYVMGTLKELWKREPWNDVSSKRPRHDDQTSVTQSVCRPNVRTPSVTHARSRPVHLPVVTHYTHQVVVSRCMRDTTVPTSTSL